MTVGGFRQMEGFKGKSFFTPNKDSCLQRNEGLKKTPLSSNILNFSLKNKYDRIKVTKD